MPVELIPLHPRFAAEITGIDLAAPPAAAAMEAIHDAFLDHAVLLFRGQDLDAAAEARIGLALAAIEAPLIARSSLLRPPALRVEAGGAPGTAPPEAAWHADGSAAAEPALACMAHAPAGRPAQGRIGFADQRAALALLPRPLRARAEGLRAEHAGPARAEHPLVRSHPITGEDSLFLDPLTTTRILNVTPAESAALLARLAAAATDPRLCWEHAWAPGDVLLWDNRVVLHTGGPDAGLLRLRIEGDRPAGTRALEMPWVVAG